MALTFHLKLPRVLRKHIAWLLGSKKRRGVSSSKDGSGRSKQVISGLAVSGAGSHKTSVPVVTGGKGRNSLANTLKLIVNQNESDKGQGRKNDVVASTDIVIPMLVTFDQSTNKVVQIVDQKDMGVKKVSSKEGQGAKGELGSSEPAIDRRLSKVK
ncbi:hypothetical protein V6N13_041618 [Hibiscus sabdariffa]